jgi:hypothetical protein
MPLAAEAGTLVVGEPVNITGRPGYDNQPAFLPDSDALLYTSIGEDAQAEIWRYDIPTRRRERMTHSSELEYSPTLLPGGDGFSVVRVEADGRQRLWRFEADWTGPRLLAPDVEPVGYHAWIDPTTVALYILGAGEEQPSTLEIFDLRQGTRRPVARAVGRSIAAVPGRREVSYVDMDRADGWWIAVLDLATSTRRALVETLPHCEDYAWTPDGTLLMPCGSGLYRFEPASAGWQRIAEFEGRGLRELSRVAISPDGRWLALVGADS